MAAATATRAPFLPGFAVSGADAAPKNVQQSLLMTASGPMVRTKLNMPEMSKLDLEAIQRTMADPSHRYNTQRSAMAESARTTGRGELREPPVWIKHDRQVLRFYGYFEELCHESTKEQSRARTCTLYYYLEDGTMMVTEPREENSGLPQGCLIKRHRVPNGQPEIYFGPEDLGTCKTITIYSRHLRLYDCDDFTRSWYMDQFGQDMHPESAPGKYKHILPGVPVQKTKEYFAQKEYFESMHGASVKNMRLQQFLDNDKRVLRFDCCWDNPTQYFIRTFFTLHYYLADDTIELIEQRQINTGRIPESGMFWRRAPLLKNPTPTCAPSMNTPDPILYKPEDLLIGEFIKVQGCDILLYDCDDFTKQWYREYENVEQEPIILQEPQVTTVEHPIPPYIGYGTEEDSMGSVVRLTPRPPRQDVAKLLLKAGVCLRFEAVWLTNKREDKNRKFIVGAHVADDQVTVWEIKNAALAHPQGKFCAKARKKNPATGEFYKCSDFYVGAVIEINAARLLLVSADDAAVAYMEQNSDQFPVADARAIALRLRQVVDDLEAEGPEMSQQRMLVFTKQRGIPLNEHECISLARAFGRKERLTSGTIFIPKLTEFILDPASGGRR